MKTSLKLILFMAVILSIAYAGAWYFMAKKINDYIVQYYTIDGPANEVAFYGEMPKLSGFPFAPVVTYKDGFEKDNVLVYFDELRVSGFPIPGLPMTIKAEGNINLVNQNIKMDIDADRIDLTFITPKSFPPNTVRENIAKWQEEVGKIDITAANFVAGEVDIKGEGAIGLDDQLQLEANLKTKTYGYEEAIEFFVKAGTVKPLVGALTISGLNAMAQNDPLRDEKYVDLDIAVAQQELYFGPIKIDSLPPIIWR